MFMKVSLTSILLLTVLLFSQYQFANTYDTSLALELAYMSAVAYQSRDSIDNWSCSPCKQYAVSSHKSFYASTANIQGFTAYSSHRNAIYVVFRGSQDIKNWIVNIGAGQTTYPDCSNCKVHTGFYSAFKTVQSQMKSQITQLKQAHPTAKIYVSGHSLGGALGLLAASSIKKAFGHVDQTYVYGCPRVGNSQFSSYLESIGSGLRIIHYADIVVHLPPSNMGFIHAHQQVWYQQDMKSYKICGAEDGCANSLSPTSYSTDDHDLAKYYLLIRSQAEWYKTLFDGLIQRRIQLKDKLISKERSENDKIQEQKGVQMAINSIKMEITRDNLNKQANQRRIIRQQ